MQRHQNAQVKQVEQGNSDTAGESSGAELGSECESFQTNVRRAGVKDNPFRIKKNKNQFASSTT